MRSKINKINLIGFDGVNTSANENLDITNSLKIFSKFNKRVEIRSLTPTNFPFKLSSKLFL